MDKSRTEKWGCNVCGSPCRVEIVYMDDKLPDHLKGIERFQNRGCLIENRALMPTPNWKRVAEEEDNPTTDSHRIPLLSAIQQELAESLKLADVQIAAKKLSGNRLKEEFWKGKLAAFHRMLCVVETHKSISDLKD